MADVTYPVIFSAPMIVALLDGHKTQTRRLAWSDASGQTFARHHRLVILDSAKGQGTATHLKPSPWKRRYDKFQAGERPWLWVKETFARIDDLTHNDPGALALAEGGFFRADDSTVDGEIKRWRPSIHMPKRLSRLSLRVTDMRMERLQDISEEDARAEGAEKAKCGQDDSGSLYSHRTGFVYLWGSIYGTDSWLENPAVIITQFEIHRENIERITHG